MLDKLQKIIYNKSAGGIEKLTSFLFNSRKHERGVISPFVARFLFFYPLFSKADFKVSSSLYSNSPPEGIPIANFEILTGKSFNLFSI
jgi:hypothetical protein